MYEPSRFLVCNPSINSSIRAAGKELPAKPVKNPASWSLNWSWARSREHGAACAHGAGVAGHPRRCRNRKKLRSRRRFCALNDPADCEDAENKVDEAPGHQVHPLMAMLKEAHHRGWRSRLLAPGFEIATSYARKAFHKKWGYCSTSLQTSHRVHWRQYVRWHSVQQLNFISSCSRMALKISARYGDKWRLEEVARNWPVACQFGGELVAAPVAVPPTRKWPARNSHLKRITGFLGHILTRPSATIIHGNPAACDRGHAGPAFQPSRLI